MEFGGFMIERIEFSLEIITKACWHITTDCYNGIIDADKFKIMIV